MATLAAVLWFYRGRVGSLCAGALRRDTGAWLYAAKLAVATLPAVAFALLFRGFIERQFDSTLAAGIGLLATGTLLITTRWTLPRATLEAPSFAIALAMGFAQALAILPGVSRSGATVCVALALGLRPLMAAEFSFLMSILAIGGALVLQLVDFESGSASLGPLALGMAVAVASGLLALALFVRLLRSGAFHRFAFYAWALGAVAVAWSLD